MSVATFPFSALVGQDPLREALLACAVDPRIGGVLVRGERGTAKTTAVRALAPVLPPVDVFAGCRFAADPGSAEGAVCPDGPHAADAGVQRRPVALVELPIGATVDRLLGTLDLDSALTGGGRAFQPGLLAAAHRGILYVDEVNLLPDHLVDVLLDAAALGRNHVERDGLSVTHPARFMLVGTMNPEEGDLRPQLLDRFGLSVEVAASSDPAERVQVVRHRLSHDADPAAFAERFAAEERSIAARVAAARKRLPDVDLDDRMLLVISGICARLGVDGLRADVVCARTATALAALDGDSRVEEDHVRRAAVLALGHRRRRGPLEAPGLDSEELERALDEARGDAGGPGGDGQDGPPDGDDPPDGGGPVGDAGTGDGGEGAGRPQDAVPVQGAAGQASQQSAPGGATPASRHAGEPQADRGEDDDATAASRPSSRGGQARDRHDSPAAPGETPVLALAGAGRGAAGRRSRSRGRDGVSIDSRRPAGPVADLHVAATLRAAAQRRAGRTGAAALLPDDVREHVRAGREGNLVVFCVDASGSMGARRRMSAVKGAVLGLLLDAYQRRDGVALIAFRGAGADLVLPPTSSVERAAAALAQLRTGGGTPLAAGIDAATGLLVRERRRQPDRRSLAVLVTDGRASGGTAGRAAARDAASRLARVADGIVVFDGEEGPVRLALAGELASAAGAPLLPLSALDPSANPKHRRAA